MTIASVQGHDNKVLFTLSIYSTRADSWRLVSALHSIRVTRVDSDDGRGFISAVNRRAGHGRVWRANRIRLRVARVSVGGHRARLTCQRSRWTQRRLCRLVVRLHILPFRRRCARDDDDAAGTAATAIGGISARLQTAAHDDPLAWRHHPLPRWTCVCGWYDDACYGSRHAFICRPCRSLVVTAWWLRRDAICTYRYSVFEPGQCDVSIIDSARGEITNPQFAVTPRVFMFSPERINE